MELRFDFLYSWLKICVFNHSAILGTFSCQEKSKVKAEAQQQDDLGWEMISVTLVRLHVHPRPTPTMIRQEASEHARVSELLFCPELQPVILLVHSFPNHILHPNVSYHYFLIFILVLKILLTPMYNNLILTVAACWGTVCVLCVCRGRAEKGLYLLVLT